MNSDIALISATVVALVVSLLWLKFYRPLLPRIMWGLTALALVSLGGAITNAVFHQWIDAGFKFICFAVFVVVYNVYYNRHFSEEVVLVDEQNRPIGTAPKLATHNANTPRHRAFSVFLFNNKGELLLQQRALHKKTWPAVWSNSCCGHVMLYESNAHAAVRRTKYELGVVNVPLHELLPDYKYLAEKDGVVENEFCPVFVGFIGDRRLYPNPAEVNEVKFIPWADFLVEIKSGRHGYSPWAAEEAELLQENEAFRKLFSDTV